MGGKESKPISLTYEEALRRVTDAELSRIKDAFKRLGTLNGALSKQAFVREVLGDAVSSQLAELIFYACGGSPKGITFRDLFCSLVLLTRGNKEEKIRFIFGVYSNEAGSHVVRSEMLKQLQRSEVHYVKESVLKLFANNEKVSYDDFREWLINNPDATTITRWLLDENSTVSLSNELETPTFYQTLAGVTHLEESEILELEKRYWYLKGLSPSGRLDFETLLPMLCPPLSKILAKGVFNAFDENRDNHIDFKEMACGISAACRGPQTERQKFCFKIFDLDKDGKLREEELFLMCQSLLQLQAEEIDPSISDGSSISDEEVEKVVKEILMNHDPSEEGFVTQEEFLIWTLNDSLTSIFMDIIFQVCHIILGLKPSSPNEEGDIVLGWLRRAERKSMNVGQFWYIVNMDWWNSWLSYVSCVRDSFSLSLCSSSQNSLQSISGKKTRFQKANIEGCVAMDNSGVMVTSISSLSNGESSFTSPSSTSSGLDSDYGSGRPNSLQRHSSSTSLHKRTISSSSHSLTVFSCDSRGSSPSHSPCLTRKPNGPGLSSYVSRPSAIDNSPLIENPASKIPQLTSEGGRLKRNIPLVQGRDFVLIPDSLWKVLQQWYGGAPALPRQVIHGRSHGEVELELYPIMLKILRHVQNQNKPNLDYSNNNWVGFGSYGAAISKIADSTQYYVTSLPPLSNAFPKRYLAYLAAFSRLATLKQVYEFLGAKLRLRNEDIRLWLVKEEPAGMSLLEEESSTLEDAGIQDLSQVLLEVRNKDLSWPEEMNQISRNSSYLLKTSSKQGEKGVTGLNNLGNTCFLNAALQCCSNTLPLTTYFIRNMHLYELNPNNPCGMKGHMARQYGALIQEIWNGEAKTVAPLKLRWTIGKYSGNFTTFQQHDSQELLAFLLDGLHEDLNRVQNKPYTELKDSEGRPDTLVAQEAWENHILRNKSVIVDLFHGQLKSKVTCKICGNESVRFDPFSYLTLQLPMESYVFMEVVVIKLDGSTPIKYGIRLISDAKYENVKYHLSALTGIKEQHFMLVELSNAQIKIVLVDEMKIRSSSNVIFAYELPQSQQKSQVIERPEVSQSAKERIIFRNIQRSTHFSSPCLKTDCDERVSTQSTNCNVESKSLKYEDEASRQTESLDSALNSFNTERVFSHNSSNFSPSSTPTSVIRGYDDLQSENKGFIIAFHRKMIRQEFYFLSSQKSKPSLFGIPLIVPCNSSCSTHQDLYCTVWTQVSRLVSPLPPSESPGPNHAQDCDDSLGYEFPFILRAVERNGLFCCRCPWYRFCRGCELPCDQNTFSGGIAYLAVDWDPTALHLRYQSSLERVFREHSSVTEMQKRHVEPISLADCLEAFCSEETLEYSCDKCKKMQQASKKLQIWRLPPILIVHLKRFQFVGNKWIKSQKIVDFPLKHFDPTDYLASVPRQTILLHRAELEGVDPATYIAGLQDKDNVFLEVLPENKIIERLHPKSPASSNKKEQLSNNAIINNKYSGNSDESSVVDKRRRMRNGSVLYGDALQDFHQHRLEEGYDPLELKYNLYAIACHTGIMEGGHYVCYAKNPQGKWICFNDSSCKEVPESEVDLQSSYLLFYERDGLSVENYMPNVEGKIPCPIDEEDPDELKRLLIVGWH